MAKTYLGRHEWGLARRALLNALEKGGLEDLDQARTLLCEVDYRMGVSSVIPDDGSNAVSFYTKRK